MEGLRQSYTHLKESYMETTSRIDKYDKLLKDMESIAPQSEDETKSEHASRTRWQFWNSVAEVMNAPSNVDVAWFVCHTNRVLWSMASQGYRRADGAAFLDEVANSGRFPEAYIKKSRRSLDKYWKTK